MEQTRETDEDPEEEITSAETGSGQAEDNSSTAVQLVDADVAKRRGADGLGR